MLLEHLDSPSDRIRRLAALALLRDGEPRARQVLTGLLAREESELRRIEIASGLARHGDATGVEILRQSLRSKRRDARLDAATGLARVGDDAGQRYLRSMLSIRSHRLGAAAVLAELGDARGIDTLRKAARRSDQAARLRALVALGRAGLEEAREPLRSILDEGRYQVGAAVALAALGDDSAARALEKQLRHSSLRVEAAVALRELGAEVDVEPLMAALTGGDHVGAMSAAEALLVLHPGEGANAEGAR